MQLKHTVVALAAAGLLSVQAHAGEMQVEAAIQPAQPSPRSPTPICRRCSRLRTSRCNWRRCRGRRCGRRRGRDYGFRQSFFM